MIKLLLKFTACVSVIFILMVVCSFISITFKSGSKKDEPSTQIYQAMYTLGEYDGRIALYKKGFAMPVEIYDVYVSSLPTEEQAEILSGINAESDGEILKIIEAYTS